MLHTVANAVKWAIWRQMPIDGNVDYEGKLLKL